MDYEKAYKAVLQTATQWIKDGCTDKERICLECMFSELRESEDERIRKKLLALVKWSKSYAASGVTVEDANEMVAYLEKQKETPMPNSTELIEMWHKAKAILKEKDFRGDEWRLAQNAFMDGFARGTCVKFEKQKEQKPAVSREGILHQLFQNGSITLSDYLYLTEEQKPVEIHNPTDEEVESWRNELTEFKKFATKQAKENQLHISYTRDVMWENFCSELLSFVNSRKPVWSEEDEKILADTIFKLAGFMGNEKNIAWLKSLRPQPKQEWSKEDKEKLYQVIEALLADKELAIREYPFCKPLHEAYDNMIAFLKSLRPSWKPSEEQMKGLKFFLDFHRPQRNAGTTNWREYDAVESLYEQLKKL